MQPHIYINLGQGIKVEPSTLYDDAKIFTSIHVKDRISRYNYSFLKIILHYTYIYAAQISRA